MSLRHQGNTIKRKSVKAFETAFVVLSLRKTFIAGKTFVVISGDLVTDIPLKVLYAIQEIYNTTNRLSSLNNLLLPIIVYS